MDKLWFLRHQKKLLWLLNTPIIKVLTRRFLCIHSTFSEVGSKKILGIMPNVIVWNGEKDKQFVAEFRSTNRFGNRILFGLSSLWKTIHWWDIKIANRFIPFLNLGFDTLTFNPDSNAVDGHVRFAPPGGDTFTNVRNGAGNDKNDSTTPMVLMMQSISSSNQYDDWRRLVVLFDTTTLPSSAIVEDGSIFSLVASSKTDNFSDDVCLVSSNPTSNTALVNGDYAIARFGSTRLASDIAIASINVDGSTYNNWTLNDAGKNNVTVGGITKFGVRLEDDLDNTDNWISNSTSRVNFTSSEAGGTGADPKLTVVYNEAGGAFLFNLM